MQSIVGKNILRFIFLVLLQGLVLSYIPLPGNLQLIVSVIFILLLPHQTPSWLVLVLSFVCGFSIDVLTASSGLHAASATFAGLVRVLFWHIAERNNLHDTEGVTGTPSLKRAGLPLFSLYIGLVVLSYCIVFFSLDAFSCFDITTFYLIGGSSILTSVCVLASTKIFG